MTWEERIAAAVESHRHWKALPIGMRLDRVMKEAGFRDLVVENERLWEALDVIALGDLNRGPLIDIARSALAREDAL